MKMKKIKKTCSVCFGLGSIETQRGDVQDCPNRKCQNGYIEIEVIDEDQDELL